MRRLEGMSQALFQLLFTNPDRNQVDGQSVCQGIPTT